MDEHFIFVMKMPLVIVFHTVTIQPTRTTILTNICDTHNIVLDNDIVVERVKRGSFRRCANSAVSPVNNDLVITDYEMGHPSTVSTWLPAFGR